MYHYKAFLLVVLVSGAHGYTIGAGEGACAGASMVPQHSGTSPSTSAAPYTISLSNTSYTPGETVTGIVHSLYYSTFLHHPVFMYKPMTMTLSQTTCMYVCSHFGRSRRYSWISNTGTAWRWTKWITYWNLPECTRRYRSCPQSDQMWCSKLLQIYWIYMLWLVDSVISDQ